MQALLLIESPHLDIVYVGSLILQPLQYSPTLQNKCLHRDMLQYSKENRMSKDNTTIAQKLGRMERRWNCSGLITLYHAELKIFGRTVFYVSGFFNMLNKVKLNMAMVIK
jgi:hypothetical protein